MTLRNLTLYTQSLENSPELSKAWGPSLDLPLPRTIEVCEQLPVLDTKSLEIPLAHFEIQVAKWRGLASFAWISSNVIPYCVKQKYEELVKSFLPPFETIATLDRYFKNPTPLLIVNMGDCGYGLFSKSKIKKGTPVCTYAGKLIPSDSNFEGRADRQYTVGVRTSSVLTAIFQANTENTDFEITLDRSQHFPAFIDGSEYGNWGSFLQHLPTKDKIANKAVATANLITIGADYRYYPCYYFKAARDIEANEILGFDYGENYWKNQNKSPLFFDKYGQAL